MGLPKFWHTSCRDEMVVLCGGERKALGLDGMERYPAPAVDG
jgi:hypothetical protein